MAKINNFIIKCIFIFQYLFFVTVAEAQLLNLSVQVPEDEAHGPFQSWLNVKGYGAVGDGQVDDTQAIQNAIYDLGQVGKSTVLFLPAGKYRITKTLDMHEKYGISFTGEDPETTSIFWDGLKGGTMLYVNGAMLSQFSRITWNGNHLAGTGIGQWFNHRHVKTPSTFIRHVDEIFVDMDTGIAGGRSDSSEYGQMDSETTILRSRFINNKVAGVSLGSFNSLDWWVWDSEFINCARGVTNEFSAGNVAGAGNFMVYRSIFKGSTIADITIGNTQWFSFHNNLSVGSRRFLQAGDAGRNGAQLILQNNKIIDTTEPVSISVGNLGPLILIDNEIRSANTLVGPVVAINGWASGRDVVSIGNVYPVSNPIFLREPKTDRLLTMGDKVVNKKAILYEIPKSNSFANNYKRKIFEVPVGASSKMIQGVINIALAGALVNPIVHLPSGSYRLDKSLLIPSRSRLQIVGDGAATILFWDGSLDQPMLHLYGPSHATVRNLQFRSGITKSLAAIQLDNADQVGGRVLVDGTMQSKVVVNAVKKTKIDIRSVSMEGLVLLDSDVTVTGAANIAPIEMMRSSNLLVFDNWYEGRDSRLLTANDGVFTLIGAHWAPADPTHGGGDTGPSIYFNDFSGSATFVGMTLSLASESNGILIDKESTIGNIAFIGISADREVFINRTSPMGTVSEVAMAKYIKNYGQTQIKTQIKSKDKKNLLESLAQVRNFVWQDGQVEKTIDATDVHLLSVMTVDSGTVGISVSGN